MLFNRSLTNVLAWTGALLVVGVPVADLVLRQFGSATPQSVASVNAPVDEVVATPAVSAPQPQVPEPVAESEPEPVAPAASTPVVSAPAVSAPPAATAASTTPPAGDDPVDAFMRSGRALPSYITGEADATPTAVAPAPQPVAPAPAPARTDVAATPASPTVATPAPAPAVAAPAPTPAAPPPRVVTLPTPVSERPPSVARPAPAAPPLVVERPQRVVSAEELEDWESGPLSEFLERRQAGSGNGQTVYDPYDDYDPNGFFLDQGPNRRQNRDAPQGWSGGNFYPFR